MKNAGFKKCKELVYQLIYYQLLNMDSVQLAWMDFSPQAASLSQS
jgi:hypothetical protein